MIELVHGDAFEQLEIFKPRLIITDPPKSALVRLWEYAENNDVMLICAYSRNWIVGSDGEKVPRAYMSIISSTHGTVCDPFMGSGAIGEAALWLNRSYIGIEKRRDRFEDASERLHGMEIPKARQDRARLFLQH